MFGFGKSTQQPAQQSSTQQKPNQQQQDPNSNNQQQQEPKTGLDRFAHLLDNASNKGDGKDPANPKQPTNVGELFKDDNFTKGLRTNLRSNIMNSISQETKALMEANDPQAMQSMMADIAEASYMQALQHSASLQNLVLDEKLEGVNSSTSQLVDSKLQNQEFTQAIPQLKNPIVQLGVEAFMGKVREQNPTISAEDMKAQVTEYVSELGMSLNPELGASKQAPVKDVDNGIDWFEELGIEAPPENQ